MPQKVGVTVSESGPGVGLPGASQGRVRCRSQRPRERGKLRDPVCFLHVRALQQGRRRRRLSRQQRGLIRPCCESWWESPRRRPAETRAQGTACRCLRPLPECRARTAGGSEGGSTVGTSCHGACGAVCLGAEVDGSVDTVAVVALRERCWLSRRGRRPTCFCPGSRWERRLAEVRTGALRAVPPGAGSHDVA